MRSPSKRLGQFAAMTAALAVVAFASAGDLRAQNPNDPLSEESGPEGRRAAPAQGAMPGAPPMRPGMANRVPSMVPGMPGRPGMPNALPNNARINPAIPEHAPRRSACSQRGRTDLAPMRVARTHSVRMPAVGMHPA